MVFLFIMPGIISAMGNLHVPTLLGFVDFATPRLNNLAFWLSVLSVQLLVVALAFETGVSAGWTLYFSADRNRFQFFPCCFACNPVPASPRSIIRSRCDYFLAILQLSRNST